ncbi:MAG: fluoride efflux transporter CrcB [Verrucomicrobiota bacterium]
MIKLFLLVGLGSALGGIGRFGVSHWMATRQLDSFPYGTLSVNVLGSFLIGVLFYVTLPEGRWPLDQSWRELLLVGFCGGFTTFSTFSFQVLEQLREEQWLAAGANVVLSVVLCVLAVAAGITAARWLNPG